MAKQSKEQKLQSIHSEALEEFDYIQSVSRDERLQCLKDRRFYSVAGAQWEGPLAPVGCSSAPLALVPLAVMLLSQRRRRRS